MPHRPVRVLFCLDRLGHAGTEKQLVSLISELDKSRVLPFVCVLKPALSDAPTLECPTVTLGFTSFTSPHIFGQFQRLRRFVRVNQVDVFHAFVIDPVVFGALLRLRRSVRAAVVAFRDLGYWRGGVDSVKMRLAYRAYDAFLANSHAVRQNHADCDGIPSHRISTIYNGIPLAKVHELATGVLGAGRSGPLVGVVANLNREVKRVDVFIQAAHIIVEQEPACRFLIVGDGVLKPRLQALAERLGIAHAVRWAGNVPDVAGLLAEFQVAVLCSDSEGFSNAILEYMAAGIPIVATAVGGNVEAIDDGTTGLLVPPDNPRELANGVLRLLRDPAFAHLLGRSGMDVVRNRFDMAQCARAHEEFYVSLLRTTSRP